MESYKTMTRATSRMIGMRSTKGLILAALCLFTTDPAMFAQGGAGERWVGTWSTSEVGRPQTPPPPAPVLLPAGPNQCPPAVPAPPTFMHFKDQTLRQIIHTSIGGSKDPGGLSKIH